jgi:hypothetical protein
MDSIDKVIKDMEEEIKRNKNKAWSLRVSLTHYLTRLKALRDNNTKTLLDQVREVMAQKNKSHSQITDEIIKIIENYEKQFT